MKNLFNLNSNVEAVNIDGIDFIRRDRILQEIEEQHKLNHIFDCKSAYVYFWELFKDKENITATNHVTEALITLCDPKNKLPNEDETVLYLDEYNHWQVGLYSKKELHNGVTDDSIYNIKGWQSLPKVKE